MLNHSKKLTGLPNFNSGKILGTVRSYSRRIKRLIEFIPVIWKGYDYDYGHSIDLFKYQLGRTADEIERRKMITDWKHVTSRIRLAIKLLELGYDEGYTTEVHKRYEEEFGASEFKIVESDDPKLFYISTLWWENVTDSQENELINERFFEETSESYFRSERAKQLAWKLIAKDIERWWD